MSGLTLCLSLLFSLYLSISFPHPPKRRGEGDGSAREGLHEPHDDPRPTASLSFHISISISLYLSLFWCRVRRAVVRLTHRGGRALSPGRAGCSARSRGTPARTPGRRTPARSSNDDGSKNHLARRHITASPDDEQILSSSREVVDDMDEYDGFPLRGASNQRASNRRVSFQINEPVRSVPKELQCVSSVGKAGPSSFN